MPPAKLTTIILRDWRSHWDGHVTKVLAGPSLERTVTPGEHAVFEPTGRDVTVDEVIVTRTGERTKKVTAKEYRRVRTRLTSTKG